MSAPVGSHGPQGQACAITVLSRTIITSTTHFCGISRESCLLHHYSRSRGVCLRSCCAGEDSGRPASGRQAHHGEPALEAGQEAPSAHRRPATADVKLREKPTTTNVTNEPFFCAACAVVADRVVTCRLSAWWAGDAGAPT
ncbi:unnamed protein product [Laminaria digitata]